MTPKIDIQELQNTDEASACAEIMSSTEPWITLSRSYDDSMAILTDPAREIYVARVGDEIVGFTILVMQGAFIGYIQTVAIKPEWRNKGIGTGIIKFAEDRIFKDSPNVFLCVSSFNPHALRLYERLGYEIIGELKEYIVPGHSEILMRKSTGPKADFKKH